MLAITAGFMAFLLLLSIIIKWIIGLAVKVVLKTGKWGNGRKKCELDVTSVLGKGS